MGQFQLRFQLVKQEGKAQTYWQIGKKRRRYTTLSSKHGTSSHMHHSVTGFPPLNKQRALIQTKRKETATRPIHCKKCLDTIKLIKWQFMQRLHVEWSGITLACSDWWASIVHLQISVWGGKRQREDGYYVGKRKMLCWATKQKVSDSLFPIQSGAQA